MNIFVVDYNSGQLENPFTFTLGVFTTFEKAKAASLYLFAVRTFMIDESESEYCVIVEFEADAKKRTVVSVNTIFNPLYDIPNTGYRRDD